MDSRHAAAAWRASSGIGRACQATTFPTTSASTPCYLPPRRPCRQKGQAANAIGASEAARPAFFIAWSAQRGPSVHLKAAAHAILTTIAARPALVWLRGRRLWGRGRSVAWLDPDCRSSRVSFLAAPPGPVANTGPPLGGLWAASRRPFLPPPFLPPERIAPPPEMSCVQITRS